MSYLDRLMESAKRKEEIKKLFNAGDGLKVSELANRFQVSRQWIMQVLKEGDK